MKRCPKCTKEYEDRHHFCEDCGISLVSTDKSDSVTSEEDQERSMKESIFCEACGLKQEISGEFCEGCGHEFGIDIASNESGNLQKSIFAKDKKKYFIITSVIIVVLMTLFGAYKLGESYYSKNNQIKRYQEALLSTDGERIANVLSSTDSHFKVTKENIQVYSKYLKDNKAYLTNMVDKLPFSNASKNDIYIKKNGKKFFLYDKYDLMIQPVYFNISTNTSGMEIAINKQVEKAVSDSEKYTWKIGPLSPGAYEFIGSFDYNDKENTISQSIEQVDRVDINGKNTRNLSFELTKIKMDIVSELSEGEVLVDGHTVESLDSGKVTPLELIWRDDAKLQIKQKYGELELISEPLDFYPEDYLAENYSTEHSKMYIPIHDFSISSNVSSGDVYVNDHSIGKLSDGRLNHLTFVITEQPLKLQAKQKFEDGSELNSEIFDYERYDGYQDVYLEFPTEIEEYDISSFLNELYNHVTDYTDEDYSFGNSEIITLESYFENGDANHEFVDFKDNYILPARASETKEYISTSLSKVESVKRVGSNIYEVKYIVNYYTVYNNDTANKDQYFRYKKATFVLDDNEKLFIRDLGGADNFEEVSEREAY